MSPFTSPLLKSFSEEQKLVCTASSMPATPHAQIRPHSTPGGCVKSKVSWDHTRYPEKRLPGFSGWVFTSGHGLQGKALWPGGPQANACLPDSPRRLLCRLCLSVSGGSQKAGSSVMSLYACCWFYLGLSQFLPVMEQTEGNLPWPLIFPHWPRPGHHSLQQKQWQPA